ncbi:MAG TPA: energy transducer TonB [Rhodanobacter sp.]
MSSASLAVAHRAHPDTVRIAAISAAIAFNLAVIVVVSRPIGAALFPPEQAVSPAQQIRIIEPPKEVPPPQPIVLKPLVHPPVAPQTRTRPLPANPPVVVPTNEGNVAPLPVAVPTLAPATLTAEPVASAAPIEASLAYRSAPLKFPAQAMRERMHGNVLLRVLVDETGKPVDVIIEQSSGYTLLDRSARAQVLASWRFQPALVNGHAVRAWARIPVTFDLRQQ